jgi:uncharacterized protein
MKQGDFVWYELCTTDPAAAASFYAGVVGWTAKPSGLPGVDYTLLCVGDRQVGGVISLPPEQMPPRPVWFGYIGVDDVDAKATEISAAGGGIHKTPQDIPSIGRFAVVNDPQGAVFMLFKGAGEPASPLAMMQPGSIGWHELHSSNWEAVWQFYGSLFGWAKDEALDMGPLGTYQLFKTNEAAAGGMMTDGNAPHPYWLYYFVVDDIDAGLARVKSHGGMVLAEPREVPGGAWIIHAKDPQDGLFALVGMRRAA